ncbi:MAG: protein translocase subunit SecF [Holosporales bacterium]|jgi:preprotein translocase subunit SecF|nr:protein translocase subunit SecF [Holosporales bacterium]
MGIQLIRHDININFIGKKSIAYTISVLAILLSIIGFFKNGLNYGIDFTGGYIVETRFDEPPNIEQLRENLTKSCKENFSLQQFGSDGRDVVIKIERKRHHSGGAHGTEAEEDAAAAQSASHDGVGDATAEVTQPKSHLASTSSAENSDEEREQIEVISGIKASLGEGVSYRKIETIGPTVGKELVRNAIIAVVLSLIAIAVYIAFRFEWQFAVCGLIALAQDCICLIGMYTWLAMEFSGTSIVALLTTASYSINDTIVIFDRIRENIKRYRKSSMSEIINCSLNETLSRTVLTAGTTILATLVLCLFGGKVIESFSLPIFLGLIFGTFSSIAVSAPLLLFFRIDSEKIAAKKSKKSNEAEVTNIKF